MFLSGSEKLCSKDQYSFVTIFEEFKQSWGAEINRHFLFHMVHSMGELSSGPCRSSTSSLAHERSFGCVTLNARCASGRHAETHRRAKLGPSLRHLGGQYDMLCVWGVGSGGRVCTLAWPLCLPAWSFSQGAGVIWGDMFQYCFDIKRAWVRSSGVYHHMLRVLTDLDCT